MPPGRTSSPAEDTSLRMGTGKEGAMRRTWLRGCVAAGCVAACAGWARAEGGDTPDALKTPTFAGELRWWFFALDGDLRVNDVDQTGTAVKGTILEFGREYDLDTQSGAPELLARLNLGVGFAFSGSYMEMGSDGNRLLRRDVTYAGETYNAGDYLSSALDLRYSRAMVEWHVVDLLGVAAGIAAGGAYIRFDAEIERTTGSPPVTTTTHEIGHAPFPLLGGIVRVAPVKWFYARAEVAGGGGTWDDLEGYWLDAAAGAYLLPLRNIAIGGGVRVLHLDIQNLDMGKNAEAEGRFTLYGVYVAVEVRL